MFLYLLGVILVTSLRGVGGQKIMSFQGINQNNSCTEPYVAREHQDKYFIYAVLRLDHASAQDWWAFVVQSPNPIFNETIAMVRIDECQPAAWPNTDRMRPDTSICWKHGKDIHALFALNVVPQFNQSFFSGVWSNERSGSIPTKPPLIKLRTVAPDDERLEVNGVVHFIFDRYIVLPLNQVFSLRYCVRNINAHHLELAFIEMRETSIDDCVMLNSTLKDFRDEEMITVTLKETEGLCKRFFRRAYKIVKEKTPEMIEEVAFYKSVNGAKRMEIALFEHFALVAVLWAAYLVY